MIVALAAALALGQAQPPPAFKLIDPLPVALEHARNAPTKEPSYSASPRYGMITFDGAKAKVWFVVDGTKLYIDRNGDGDLTNDGPPIESKKLDYLKQPHVFFEWDSMSPARTKAKVTENSLLFYLVGPRQDECKLGDVRRKVDGVFWFYRNRGAMLAAKPADAPVLNYASPLGLMFDFINGTDGSLSKSKENEFYIQIGSQGSLPGCFVCRSYEDMPKDAYIEAVFEFDDARDSGKKLNLVAQLRTRC